MSREGETYATAVGCMDGKVVIPVTNYAREKFGVRFVDFPDYAGAVGELAKDLPNPEAEALLKREIQISLDKHNSQGIVVHGHAECAGNPVDDEQHKKDVIKAAQRIREMEPGVPVVPVFVERAEPEWVISELG